MTKGKTSRLDREAIVELKRCARIALAARCSRRVQPLFASAWPGAPKQHLRAVDNAITLAEYTAAYPVQADALAAHTVFAAANSNADDARAANDAFAAANDANAPANAANAAFAAANAANTALAANDANAAANAALAAFAAANATFAAANAVGRRDYELLLAVQELEEWTDETPVPPEFFGPLWPQSEPEGWPEEGYEERLGNIGYRLEIAAPEGATKEDVQEVTERLIHLFDRFIRAHGDDGIKLRDHIHLYHMPGVKEPQPC